MDERTKRKPLEDAGELKIFQAKREDLAGKTFTYMTCAGPIKVTVPEAGEKKTADSNRN